jgi:hypothetical protein
MALLLSVAASSGAQEVRLGSVYSRPDHDLLGSPLGVSFSAGVRLHRLIGFRVGYERSRDSFSSFGSTCVGFIQPEMETDCADEARRERSGLNALVLSIPVTLHSGKRFEFGVVPGFRRVWIENERTGVVSGRSPSADKDMSGFGVGAEIQVRPLERREVRLYLAAHTTLLSRYEDELEIDGYSPFEQDISLAQLEFGLSHRG